jgi:Flp pilus assembly protein TadG
MRRRGRDERGQLTLLVVGFFIVVLLLVAVVVDISKAFLVRRDLAQLADGAALAGTRGVSSSVREGTVADNIELSEEAARNEVAKYLARVEQGGYDELSWAVSVDDAEVTVRLEATIDLPFTVPGGTTTADVSADAASELTSR